MTKVGIPAVRASSLSGGHAPGAGTKSPGVLLYLVKANRPAATIRNHTVTAVTIILDETFSFMRPPLIFFESRSASDEDTPTFSAGFLEEWPRRPTPRFQSYYSDGRSGNFSDAWPGLRLNREWTVKA